MYFFNLSRWVVFHGLSFDQGDLPYWAQKFASSARMEEDFIVVELGDEVGCSMAQ